MTSGLAQRLDPIKKRRPDPRSGTRENRNVLSAGRSGGQSQKNNTQERF